MNYHEQARTNYFRVTDAGKLHEAATRLDARVEENEGKYALFADEGGFRTFDEDENEISVVGEIHPLLPENEIAVVHAVGFEGMRYFTGDAFAFDHTGKMECLCLNDIYARAAKRFKVGVDTISKVQY
jgi:hypothetical protein